ncbi:Glyoxalase/Bleomycin resistance protein/Dihydroxybiphenyl dioxygenase [Aspergillus pseudodeflectus]|uniref:Glyoxalase/Bleomycin resistance protein/Dihydroxybiphenyl dioxygenase n=1 Tax=Aspergillus pseudodeflectus TaxID=176178 RepID=A0ABR4JRQ3_9EURO
MADQISRKISLVRPSFVTYTHQNFDEATRFLEDFGLIPCGQTDDKIYYRGSSPDPFIYCAQKGDRNEFNGAGFVVEDEADLEYASLNLPNASPIRDLDSPGGGKGVTFRDPVDGFSFHLVCCQTPSQEGGGQLPALKYNFPTEKHRIMDTQRFAKGPAPIHKLGHFGLCVTDFEAFYGFFTSYFNFRASDFIFDKNGRNITVFCRLDRGLTPVDHHCFFFFEGPKAHVHHASFETHDFDIQKIGHDWLREKGYINCWGVGRHVLGSQIFDYWYDPSGFILEHYVDGDLFDNTVPTNRTLAGPDNLHVWGPDLPPSFLD